jgi:uracil-DNA glycosylase
MGSGGDVTDGDPASELAELAAALRAHAEWQRSTGAHGLPAATRELAQSRAAAPEPDAQPTPEPEHAPRAEPPSRLGVEPPLPPAPAQAPLAAAGGETLSVEERTRRLELLAEEVKRCTACRLHETRTQTVFARGTLRSGLCFVGEGPGADEDAQGYPFVGKAGQLLDRMIAAMGFERDDVMVMNAIKCRPPDNRKPEPDELAACRGFFDRQLELVGPSVMVALGATAVQALLGSSAGITRLRGSWKLYKGRIAVMPTFHPAYLLRNPAAKRDVWNDLQQVLRHMGRPVPPARKG